VSDYRRSHDRLGLDNKSPQSPTPALSRTQSFTAVSAEVPGTPLKSPTLSNTTPAPLKAQVTPTSAMGENVWDSPADAGRAKRELSVIDERESSAAPADQVIDLTKDDDEDLTVKEELRDSDEDAPTVDEGTPGTTPEPDITVIKDLKISQSTSGT
jgi:hypothetical protein